MKEVHLIGVSVEPNESVEIELGEGCEKYLAFYPGGDISPYLNINFLDAELCEGKTDPARHSIRCQNTDGSFPHEIWVVQFNHPLPPIFQIAPWQILVAGKIE